MNTENQAQAVQVRGQLDNVAVKSLPHTGTYHYKSFPKDESNKGYNSLMSLVNDGKLSMDDIEEQKRDDGTPVLKRKSRIVPMEVPDIRDMLRADTGLTDKQVNYLQDMVTKHIEDAQREDIDSVNDTIRHWTAILDDDFSKRRASTKVTKEQVAEAAKILNDVLEAMGAKQKPREYTVKLAENKFGASVTKSAKPEVLERIQQWVLDAFNELEDTPEQATYAPVFDLWLDNLKKALQPPESDIDEDLFELE
tara:strand:+ start:2986 stop:3741 length:756 start_codon:yes stop_codon:yes gene_type:complete